ncbi:MAG: SCP2 sterol-binding domain-containing protein [Deltaproteobacteria bacterium]|nr:SCP2 sterol-binding domain-containing protein [Deltaproteobacteria bacterium]
MIHHASTLAPPAGLTAERFLGDLLPRVMGARADLCRGLGGSVLIELSDERAPWRIDFDQVVVSRQRGEEAPRLTVRLSARALEDWIAGRLDLARAIATGQVGLEGDGEMLGALASILRP